MNRRTFIKRITAGAGFLAAAPWGLKAGNNRQVVSILHTNDLHCQIEPFDESNQRYGGRAGLARISGLVNNIRMNNPNTLLFDAGDMFQGTPYFNFFGGELMFKAMTMAGYDAGTVGNHEFDNGMEGLLDPLPEAGFPLINSNYDFSDTPLAGHIPRYKIFNLSGVRVGVYGLGIELKGLVAEKHYGATRYDDPLAVALEMEQFLALNQNCDLVVCLSHLGHQYQHRKISDQTLAPELLFTDLIIGGHTHSFLKEPLQIRNKAGNMTIVNQAGWGGLMLGHIDFEMEKGNAPTGIVKLNSEL